MMEERNARRFALDREEAARLTAGTRDRGMGAAALGAVRREAEAMTKLLIYPADKPGDTYTVPDGVTEIDTFEHCDLKTINMPDSVTKIDGSAFEGCDRIEEIVLPPKLSEIPSYLFWGNDRLKKDNKNH